MKLKSIVASAVLAIAATSSFAATTHNYSQAILTGADQVVDTFVASGGFSSSFTFYNAPTFAAWLTDGSTTYQYLDSGSGSLSFGPFMVDYDNLALGGSLPNGTWSLHVQGTSGATYVGGATFNAGAVVPTSPVPEPETYAMLLAGLGAVGFMSRRRKPN